MVPSSSHSSCSAVVLGSDRSQTPTPLLTVAVRGAEVGVEVGTAVGGSAVGDGIIVGEVTTAGVGEGSAGGRVAVGSVVTAVGRMAGVSVATAFGGGVLVGAGVNGRGLRPNTPNKIKATMNEKIARTRSTCRSWCACWRATL